MIALEHNILATVQRDGFVVQRIHLPDLSTVEVARRLGTIVDIETILPTSGIPTVQSLRPREISEVGKNQYSGNYGVDLFPLHTDLAHWILPPHYLLLRCLVGTEDVFTNLLSCADVVGVVGAAVLQKAVLRARKRRYGSSGLVRAMSSHCDKQIFRWDPIFLEPLNRHALALKRAMSDSAWKEAMIRIQLQEPGDILLIDNWRILHGRSQVPARGITRHIERVYLSEVFSDC